MAKVTTEQIEKLQKKGKKVKWIANKYNITRQAVYCHLDKIKQKQQKQNLKAAIEKPKKDYNALIDWHVYNEGLVKRGEFLLDLEVVKDWVTELKLMNEDKAGAKFIYPDSYILFLLRLKSVFQIDYRTTEGLGRKLIILIPHAEKSCHYTTLQRRLKKLGCELQVYKDNGEQKLATDASGLKTSNREEYRMNKYRGERKQYIKLHIGVDTKTSQVTSCVVTDESICDNKKMDELIEQSEKAGKVVGYYLVIRVMTVKTITAH